MTTSPGTGGRKKSARVEVVYFPSRKKKATAPTLAIDPSQMPTAPGVDLGSEELVTEPAFFPDMAELERVARKATPAGVKLADKGQTKRRRTRTSTPIEMPVITAQNYEAKLRNMLLAGRKAARSASMKALQEALSLFGHKMFEAGKLPAARSVFEGLVAAGSDDAFAHTMLGVVYLAQGEDMRALALFEAALAIDPDELPALVYRGEIRLRHGKVRAALEDLRRVLALPVAGGSEPFVERAKQLLRVAEKRARKRAP